MSKHEAWRTRHYWHTIGGLLIEEFQAVAGNNNENIARRLIDGIIVPSEPGGIQRGGSFDFTGKDIVVVQTKSNRLGMYLMGQAFFSREIMKRYRPRSIKTVAICGKGDAEMQMLCHQHDIDVAVIDDNQKDGT